MTPGERRLVAKFVREALVIRYGKEHSWRRVGNMTSSAVLQQYAVDNGIPTKRAVEIHNKIRDLATEILTFLAVVE